MRHPTALKEIRLVEFFSGIGGMRLALHSAVNRLTELVSGEEGVKITSILSVDTSMVVNQCYLHNFPNTVMQATKKRKRQTPTGSVHEQLRQANIESLKVSDLEGAGNIWTMSPPCQPFTTTDASKQLGGLDKRNKAFTHIMKLLKEVTVKPEMIVFENVKGFENSLVHMEWMEVLKAQGYVWRQYRCSPLSLGVPMNRTRFYMVCLRSSSIDSANGSYSTENVSFTKAPKGSCKFPLPFEGMKFKGGIDERKEAGFGMCLAGDISGSSDCLPLRHFVLPNEEIGARELEQLVLSDEVLRKPWAKGLSIVGEDDRVTFCFTSSYGQRMHKSSGSTFHMSCPRGKRINREGDLVEELTGKVRLFSPRELLRLFGFPSTYSFPQEMKLRQQWRLIGQSISVTVVQAIMHDALCEYFKPECKAG